MIEGVTTEVPVATTEAPVTIRLLPTEVSIAPEGVPTEAPDGVPVTTEVVTVAKGGITARVSVTFLLMEKGCLYHTLNKQSAETRSQPHCCSLTDKNTFTILPFFFYTRIKFKSMFLPRLFNMFIDRNSI